MIDSSAQAPAVSITIRPWYLVGSDVISYLATCEYSMLYQLTNNWSSLAMSKDGVNVIYLSPHGGAVGTRAAAPVKIFRPGTLVRSIVRPDFRSYDDELIQMDRRWCVHTLFRFTVRFS